MNNKQFNCLDYISIFNTQRRWLFLFSRPCPTNHTVQPVPIKKVNKKSASMTYSSRKDRPNGVQEFPPADASPSIPDHFCTNITRSISPDQLKHGKLPYPPPLPEKTK